MDNISKIIIFGASGMLGNYLYTYLSSVGCYNVVPLTRTDLDVSVATLKDIDNLLQNYGVGTDTLIINAVGVVPQTGNPNYKNYIKINTLFPHHLAYLSTKYGYKFIHPTTNCVFSGMKIDGNYNEDDEPDETDIYGVTKQLGEPDSCCVIRTSLIGEEVNHNRSLVAWVFKNKGGAVDGYTNHFWNGVSCLQFAKIVHQIIKYDIFWKGVRHIYSPNSVSKYELVSMINDVYKCSVKIKKTCDDQKRDKTLCSKYGMIFDVPSVDDQIREMSTYELFSNQKTHTVYG